MMVSLVASGGTGPIYGVRRWRIAREAGAAVTDAFGQPLNYNKRDPRDFGVLASSVAIHAAAVDRLAERARHLAEQGQ